MVGFYNYDSAMIVLKTTGTYVPTLEQSVASAATAANLKEPNSDASPVLSSGISVVTRGGNVGLPPLGGAGVRRPTVKPTTIATRADTTPTV